VGDAFDLPSSSTLADAILFRPAVIRNRATGKYVLWVNVIPRGFSVLDGLLKASYRVGVASRPEGPFTLTATEPHMALHADGDFGLLEHEGRAWIAYNSFQTDHSIAVQELDASFTDVAPGGNASIVSINDQENVALFESGGKFYLIHGNLCCFCPEGSNVLLSVALSPMGPYTRVRELNPRDEHHMPRIPAQSNGVFKVQLSSGRQQLVWSGDMWQSSLSGLKGRDVQVWLPLDVHSDAPLNFTRTWQLGEFAKPIVAPFPPSRVGMEYAKLMQGGASPFPRAHEHVGPHLEYFAVIMLVLIVSPFVVGGAVCFRLSRRGVEWWQKGPARTSYLV